MKTEPKRIDESAWGPGPWQDEPDRIEWKTKAGLPGLMVRQPKRGHWCGYVAVPPGHPWHCVDLTSWDEGTPSPRVHGGITYAEKCLGQVCHAPAPGEPDDVWWVGFDCAHYQDYSPADLEFDARFGFASPGDVYRDAAYVRAEVERLARQAAAARGDGEGSR